LRGSFNSILQRHYDGFRADHRLHIFGSFFHLPSFYAEQNHVYRSNLRGIIRGFGGLDEYLTGWRFNA
jgi:hypothetical protein